jgi:GMP synthase (glutamine-hydrolysing)
VTHLASSEKAPFQAFRVGEAPVYATQFHPELDWQDQRLRFLRYFDMYSGVFGTQDAKAMVDSFRPTPESCSLLAGFRALIS